MGAEYYLAIDVGATKTLLAVFAPGSEVVCEVKIKTEPDYGQFKDELGRQIQELKSHFSFSCCCCAMPATFDFKNGTAVAFGNESWHDVPVKSDLETLLPGVKILVHNDAKLAALSEAVLLQKKYKRVLYITISTGIGGGVITNDVIDPDFENFEPGQMVFEYDGKLKQWEDMASGRALKKRYGKLASQIEDEAIWREYAQGLAAGFENLLATIKPDVVVVGGGVGAHFEKFKPYLEEELAKINNPLVPTPPLLKARRPEEAVVYGCYDYIRQNA